MTGTVRRTALLTALALLAFAGNSILCRLALGSHAISPAGFTAVRLGAGAAALWLLVALRTGGVPKLAGQWASAAALFAYAAAFSFAYVSLGAGTGALILFGAVQLTMILAGLRAGERPAAAEWIGLGLAVSGLVVLVFPGLTSPAPAGAALMAAAGVAWGVYSLRGRGSAEALRNTAGNFLLTVPMAALLLAVAGGTAGWTARGALLAAISGALASGVGYAIWYTALPSLTATRAALVQLLVPVIAAAGGVALLGEAVPLRLPIAAALVLGGVALAVTSRSP
ncbi:MAG TPA: DMT family transporter [Gemmatimonadales bacterium]|nr:DMT family transporter [Gemmatimonadales bacterium]HRZ08406.1 DMT family transporter [Gemmatimonadales bacterium]